LFAYDGPYGDLTGVGGQDGGPNLVALTFQKQLYDGVTIRYPVYYSDHTYAVATRVIDPGVVPEPSTLALVGLAAVALTGSRRRRVSPVPQGNPTVLGPNGTKRAL
jgi:hypothetical protein